MGNRSYTAATPKCCYNSSQSKNYSQTDQKSLKQLKVTGIVLQKERNQQQDATFLDINQKFDGFRKQKLSVNTQNLKKMLQQGSTIVSGGDGQKYLVHLINFNKEEDYNSYTDTLVYRFKMLSLCKKAKQYINPVIAIYGEKTYTCSACNPCTSYRAYVFQHYYPFSLEQFLSNPTFSYFDLYDIFHSFVKVMSAFQYKRLRFGNIDLSAIYVHGSDHFDISSSFLQGLDALSGEKNNQNFTSKSRQKRELNYFCKINDPFIRQFPTKAKKGSDDSREPIIDFYKEEVLKVGQALSQILRQKSLRNSDIEISCSNISYMSQLRVKQFLENMVSKYMICPLNSRYNWLQIQRHFQQLHSNDTLNIPSSMIQSFKTQQQYKPTFSSQADLRTRSVEKNAGNTLTYFIPDSLKSLPRKNVQINSTQNKENVGQNANSYITLKPYKKSDSKPNIAITIGNTTNQPILIPSPKNILPPSSHPQRNFEGPHPSGHFGPDYQLTQGLKGTLAQIQKNSGYGVVENLHPEKSPDNRIKYENLYNIGKCWLKFEGNFNQGSKEGPGTIYLTNGHIFTGFFQKDLANGKGSVFVNGDLVLKGTWKNNILVTQF